MYNIQTELTVLIFYHYSYRKTIIDLLLFELKMRHT